MTTWPVIAITCAFMLADIVSGFLKAWHAHDVQSKALREGLFHKGAFLLSIGLCQGVEYAADWIPQIELDIPITGAVCAYIILTELVSILENLKQVNPDIGGIADRLASHGLTPGTEINDTGTASEDDDEN